MKKTFGILFFLMAAGTLSMIFTSCGSGTTTSPAPTPTPTPTPCAGVFGQSVTVGGTGGYANFGTGYTWYSAYNLPQAGAVTAVAVLLPGSSTELEVGLYTDNAAFPQNRVAYSGPVTTSASGWATVGFGPVTLTAATYWLAIGIPATSPSGLVGINNTVTNLYGSSSVFPATFTNDNAQSYEMAILGLYKHTCP